MKSLLVRSIHKGVHVRATFFMGNKGFTRANLGTIAFREDEFGPFCEAIYMGAAWVDDLEVEIRAAGEDEQSPVEKVSREIVDELCEKHGLPTGYTIADSLERQDKLMRSLPDSFGGREEEDE